MMTKDKLYQQFMRIKQLENGWLDGDGTSFDKSFIDNVHNKIKKIIKDPENYPYVYGDPEGFIHAEWPLTDDWFVSCEFYIDGKMEFYVWNCIFNIDDDYITSDIELAQKYLKKFFP